MWRGSCALGPLRHTVWETGPHVWHQPLCSGVVFGAFGRVKRADVASSGWQLKGALQLLVFQEAASKSSWLAMVCAGLLGSKTTNSEQIKGSPV